MELRKLRRQRQGIDSTKLNAGIIKKKKKTEEEPEVDKYGLRLASKPALKEEEYVFISHRFCWPTD